MQRISLFVLLLGLILLSACRSEYEQMVIRESKTGVYHDSLLFDYTFGISRDLFFKMTHDLNKQKLVTQGAGTQKVLYVFQPGEFPSDPEEIWMHFDGIFNDDKDLVGMELLFSYPKWFLGTEKYGSEQLIPSLKQYFQGRFPGNDFVPIDIGLEEIVPLVKIDGNRQIVIFPKDDKDVIVKIEDLKDKFALN